MFTNIPLSFIAKGGKLMRPTLNEILWCYQTLLDADIQEFLPQGVIETIQKEFQYRLLERKLNLITKEEN